MDGSANMSGTFTQENGRLTIQGHPVIHASTSQSIANTVSSLGDNSVLTQPTSFTQDDWENRTFSFGSLVLKDTDFGLGRNATLNTTIQADNSSVTLGDSRVFIDKKMAREQPLPLKKAHLLQLKMQIKVSSTAPSTWIISQC